jgi:biopolymer transport protein ExbB
MFHLLLQSGVDSLNKANNGGMVSPNGTPVTTTQPTQKVFTLMDLLTEGGFFMTFLLILLLIFFLMSVYFAIQRLIVVSKAGKTDRNFMNNIRDYLLNGKVDSARELCRASNTPVARVIEKGISRLGKPNREIMEAMETTGQVEIAYIEKNLHFITLVSRIAPMLGFVGTIVGVIVIFHDIANSNGEVSIQNISNGLYLKMFSSAAGLVVGLLAFMMHHFINAMIDGVSKNIERSSLQFLDMINEPAK